jgi:hypothetical protein
LRIKEQETCLTLHEHDDDDDLKIKPESIHKLKTIKRAMNSDQTRDMIQKSGTNSNTICGENCESLWIQASL